MCVRGSVLGHSTLLFFGIWFVNVCQICMATNQKTEKIALYIIFPVWGDQAVQKVTTT